MHPVCRRCSALLIQQTRTFASSSVNLSVPKPASAYLSKPTWSVASLLPPSTKAGAPETSPEEPISKAKLHHLLRLSALPLPDTEAAESAMLRTLHSQLHFVRDVQRVDTTGLEPLRSLRDETIEGVEEVTIGLEELQDALGNEIQFGHKKRPKRVRGEEVDTKGAEDWDPLKTASRTAGKYFVVQSKKEES
ncbi:Glutamyl-tRNA(Gln) amidotransferase subunit F [Colletotrichum shisoi]|uniref:Glutamyl-tRNA(Gln) amidotransferase subunit F n=1 Tax=Colletotrichum shisoi TaxID=2078593 RepID=A0A5Q4BYZ1_9PEZI|nr:Glutamyl-tRNA(Gln) amidotransferase subunit F [Colletotrichum shisoi]